MRRMGELVAPAIVVSASSVGMGPVNWKYATGTVGKPFREEASCTMPSRIWIPGMVGKPE